jgi:mannitol-1-phosphate/altronate dehydrogenase
MCCCAGVDADGRAIALEDPIVARRHQDILKVARDPVRLVDRMLDMVDIFGTDLPRDAALRSSLVQAVSLLQQRRADGAVAACLGGELAETAAHKAELSRS